MISIPNWIQTESGKQFWFPVDDLNSVDIADIAKALSNTCRFNGHCSTFYSVAEHSVLVSYEVSQGFEKNGLLHDASEAYLNDIPRPFKYMLPDYVAMEKLIQSTIERKFSLEMDALAQKEVKRADIQLLRDEREVLMKKTFPWDIDTLPVKNIKRIVGYPPVVAREKFLDRFSELFD